MQLVVRESHRYTGFMTSHALNRTTMSGYLATICRIRWAMLAAGPTEMTSKEIIGNRVFVDFSHAILPLESFSFVA
jgi:hypothetical protein